MLYYRKVRIESHVNGSLRQEGILIVNDSNVMVYATNSDSFENAGFQHEQNPQGFCTHAAYCYRISTDVISFATASRMMQGASNNIVRLNGNSVEINVPVDMEDITFSSTATSASADATSLDAIDTVGVAVKSGYTTTETYSGFGAYHSNQRIRRFNLPRVADKPWRIGIELELYAKNNDAYRAITNSRSNWYQCEADASLSEASFPIEMKTIPLRACDAKSVDFWDRPMARLKELASSKKYGTTGLHVHIGKEILGTTDIERNETLGKLLFFYVHLVEDDAAAHDKNKTICGREYGYCCNRNTVIAAKSELFDLVKDGVKDGVKALNNEGWKHIGKEMVGKNRERWDVNTGPLCSYGTIEFRKGKGSISKTRIAAVVTWWEQMCLYCRQTNWDELNFNSFFQKVTSENPCVAYFFNQDEEA